MWVPFIFIEVKALSEFFYAMDEAERIAHPPAGFYFEVFQSFIESFLYIFLGNSFLLSPVSSYKKEFCLEHT